MLTNTDLLKTEIMWTKKRDSYKPTGPKIMSTAKSENMEMSFNEWQAHLYKERLRCTNCDNVDERAELLFKFLNGGKK